MRGKTKTGSAPGRKNAPATQPCAYEASPKFGICALDAGQVLEVGRRRQEERVDALRLHPLGQPPLAVPRSRTRSASLSSAACASAGCHRRRCRHRRSLDRLPPESSAARRSPFSTAPASARGPPACSPAGSGSSGAPGRTACSRGSRCASTRRRARRSRMRVDPGLPACGYLFLAHSEQSARAAARERHAAERARASRRSSSRPAEAAELVPGLDACGVVGGAWCAEDGYFDRPQASSRRSERWPTCRSAKARRRRTALFG